MKNKALIISGVAAGLILIYGVTSYNGLVVAQENVSNKYSQVDNQLKRRADLIPNLVESVKGYTNHEQKAIDSVTNARAQLAGAKTPADKAAADQELSGALSRLLVVAENYPNLKADKNYQLLMDSLEGSENRLSIARKDYNDKVTVYNNKIKKFPKNIIANLFNFDKKEYFETTEQEKETPKVDFGSDN